MMDENVLKLIEQALNEDIYSGDITSERLIPGCVIGKGEFTVKTKGIIGGIDIVKSIFSILDKDLICEFLVNDGEFVENGRVMGIVHGRIKSILSGERTALNFLQRISGIATKTKRFVEKVSEHNLNIKVSDTRKTTPNFRYFEKLAVKIGGGINHRYGLYDMILIKDNHIKSSGGIDKCIGLLGNIPSCVKTEIEVKKIDQINEIAKTGFKFDRIMLDNFYPAEIPDAVNIIKECFPNTEIEVSGGINESNFDSYLLKGVDIISIGSLTHSYDALDISLDIIHG